jgi:hypothetical protein
MDKTREPAFSRSDRDILLHYKSMLDDATKYIPVWVKAAVAIALGLGTMIGWKRIVVTVGEKIGKTHLSYGQGASAELVAMTTIGAADLFGLPVSTTQVLSSGVAGTMAANRSGLQWQTVRHLALAWVLTLPASIVAVRISVLDVSTFHIARAAVPEATGPAHSTARPSCGSTAERSIRRGKRLEQSFRFRPESAPPGIGIMRMFDMEYGVEMCARFTGSALFDEESGQDEMGIGITSVRRNRAPQIRFGLFLATAQQPGQLRIEASHHLQRLRMARIELDRPTDMLPDFPQHQPGIGDSLQSLRASASRRIQKMGLCVPFLHL